MNADGCLYPLYFRMMAGLVILQPVTKIIETEYIFMKKFCKNVRLAQTYPEFHLPLVKCYVKSRKDMLSSSGQEWPRRLATNIEQEGGRAESASLTIFEADFFQN